MTIGDHSNPFHTERVLKNSFLGKLFFCARDSVFSDFSSYATAFFFFCQRFFQLFLLAVSGFSVSGFFIFSCQLLKSDVQTALMSLFLLGSAVVFFSCQLLKLAVSLK